MRLFTFTLFLFFNSIYGQSQDLIPYQDDHQCGYADIEGHVVIPSQFDEALFFEADGTANVRIGQKWSLINPAGKILFPFLSGKPIQLLNVYAADTSWLRPQSHGHKTLADLRMLEISLDSFELINIKTWKTTTMFFRKFSQYAKFSGVRPETSVTFTWGIFIVRISDTSYQVIDTSLNCIFISNNSPVLENDSLLTTEYHGQSLIYNFKNHHQSIFPYPNIEDIIHGKFCIASNQIKAKSSGFHSRGSVKKVMMTDLVGVPVFKRDYNDLEYLFGSLLKANSNDTFYFIDFQGSRKSRETYKQIYLSAKYYYLAQLFNDKWVLLDSMGNRALSSIFDQIEYHENEQYFSVTTKQTTSLLDNKLKLLIKFNADYIYKTSSPDLYVFGIDKKEGLINSKGKVVVSPMYDQCYPMANNKYIQILEQKKSGILRLNGSKILDSAYDEIYAQEINGYWLFFGQQGEFYSCFDERGHLLADSLSSTYSGTYKGLSWISKNSRYYLFDTLGQAICEPFESLSTVIVAKDSTELLYLRYATRSYLLDTNGHSVIPDGFSLIEGDSMSDPETGLFGVSNNDEEGVIDHQSRWIIPLNKQIIQFITPYLIGVKRSGNIYLYRPDGTVIDHHPYDLVEYGVESPLYLATRNNKVGYIDAYSGNEIIPLEYDEGWLYNGFQAKMTSGTEIGHKMTFLFDTLGQLLLTTPYDDLYPLDSENPHTFYKAYKNGLQAIIDYNGNEVIHFDSLRLQGFADSTFFTRIDKDCNLFLVNRKMEVLYASPHFPKDHIELPNRNYLFLFKGYSVIVDHDGQVLKKIDSDEIENLWLNNLETKFLKVNGSGRYYFFNTETLVEYKS